MCETMSPWRIARRDCRPAFYELDRQSKEIKAGCLQEIREGGFFPGFRGRVTAGTGNSHVFKR